MGIRSQWSKPWTITTKDSDFSTELQNILDEQFNPDHLIVRMQSGVRILPTYKTAHTKAELLAG